MCLMKMWKTWNVTAQLMKLWNGTIAMGSCMAVPPQKLKLLYGPAVLVLNIYQDVNREDKVSKN